MKIGQILFPVDFSDHCRAMNADVEWLVSHFNSRLTLLHVFEMPTSWYDSGAAPIIRGADFRAYAYAEMQRLEQYPIEVPESKIERISAEGSADWHIAEWTKNHPVDLIVMGTQGYGPFRRLLLGSVTMKVLHDVACPVWTHPARPYTKAGLRLGFCKILCSLELAEEAVALLRFTKSLAADLRATVDLIHCVPATASRPAKYFDYDLHGSLQGLAREEISSLQCEAGTDFPLHITAGSITEDLVEMAIDQQVDLVVIGRGKSQGTFGTLWTCAFEIIRQAPCPVLSFSMEQDVG